MVKTDVGERVVDLSAQYAVSSKTIYGWLRQDTGEAVVSMLEFNKLKRENEELKRLVGELLLSCDSIPKKMQIVGSITIQLFK